MPFHKLHGLGNDFVLIDGRAGEPIPDVHALKLWSDRRTGIGFDQLIYLSQKSEQLHYRFFNADGTEAEQCGNGQRALALYLQRSGWSDWPVSVQGLGGEVILNYVNDDEIEATLNVKVKTEVKGDGVSVDVGNPHWVKKQANLDVVDWPIHAAQAESLFPQGVNIELIEQMSGTEMRIRINERGVGETQACGSGACAAAWAGHILYGMSERIKVRMPGGPLVIVCDVNHDRISLIGPARYVYQGEIES